MKCPKCGAEMKFGWQEASGVYRSYETGELEQEVKTVWECSQCGYTESDEEIPY